RAQQTIAADLAKPHPMRRLLQGDVGSGKTLVAALAALQAIENGWQAALMAPTEILAEQHYLKLAHWLEPLGVRIAWLSGGLKAREKKAAIEAIAAGETQLAIGTHALFQEGVTFAKLGLAIVDEQHRFGVEQRLALAAKGGTAPEPHQLQTAIETFETIKATFPDLAVGLVHGRMKPAEKAQVMADFKARRIQLLVATTVIEVGVDVPNATLMVIEHAERMGLAQLHQLR